MSDSDHTPPLPFPDVIPFRKTTRIAVAAAMAHLQRSLAEIAEAGVADGEAPAGYVFDVDNSVWRTTRPIPISQSAS